MNLKVTSLFIPFIFFIYDMYNIRLKKFTLNKRHLKENFRILYSV